MRRFRTASPEDRRAIYRSMIEVLARLHRVDWRAVGLEDFGKPGNYVARQVRRWTAQYQASETERIDAMERLIEWLPAHIPPDDAAAIVHGDYRPEICCCTRRTAEVAAVIDWELSTIGHPLVDLGHHALLFRTGPEDFGAFADRLATGGHSERSRAPGYLLPDHRTLVAPRLGVLRRVRDVPLRGDLPGIMGRVVAGHGQRS